MAAPSSNRRGEIAFLLAQLGKHAADQFAERISALGLVPAQAGIVCAIAADPGRSQQALSEQLGPLPSRVVSFVDDLERQGWVVCRRNPTDRRLYALYLSAAGEERLRELSVVARRHEQAMTAGLSAANKSSLAELLTGIAARQGLSSDVHQVYRGIGGSGSARAAAAAAAAADDAAAAAGDRAG
ncbi:MAG: mexR [Frankiales bacterium]|nr:mexR [Frankiales bacterium]